MSDTRDRHLHRIGPCTAKHRTIGAIRACNKRLANKRARENEESYRLKRAGHPLTLNRSSALREELRATTFPETPPTPPHSDWLTDYPRRAPNE